MESVETVQDKKLLARLTEIKHILLVLSGKGGVGKSSISVQLALSLLALDPSLRIGLLDIDLTGPSLPKMLGLEGKDVHMSTEGWVPVYLNSNQEQVTGKLGEGVLACMSIGFLLKNSSESVVWRGPKKNAMIKQFLTEVRWGKLDYLIIDTPPGESPRTLGALRRLMGMYRNFGRTHFPPRESPTAPRLSSRRLSTATDPLLPPRLDAASTRPAGRIERAHLCSSDESPATRID